MTFPLPDVEVRGWKLVVVTWHGVRVWWHLDHNEPWVAGVHDHLSREARLYVMACTRSWQTDTPAPPPPETGDVLIPWDAYTGLIELDVATLMEGDPV